MLPLLLLLVGLFWLHQLAWRQPQSTRQHHLPGLSCCSNSPSLKPLLLLPLLRCC